MVAPANRIQDRFANLEDIQSAACQAIEEQPAAFALAAFGLGVGVGVGLSLLMSELSAQEARQSSLSQQVADAISRMLPNAVARQMASFGR